MKCVQYVILFIYFVQKKYQKLCTNNNTVCLSLSTKHQLINLPPLWNAIFFLKITLEIESNLNNRAVSLRKSYILSQCLIGTTSQHLATTLKRERQ